MVNLFDITRGTGGGYDALSRQFGLDPAQTSKAVEALLPAFSLAFQRMALNPSVFADFLKTVGSGRYAPFPDMGNPAQAAVNGGAILNQLFKSPEAAQEVANQAATLAGVGAQALQEMMPILAAQIVGGMARYATAEGFADLLRQWADALKAASDRIDPPRPQDPWSAWQGATTAMMGLSSQPAPASRPRSTPEPAAALDAWVRMVGAMMGQGASFPGTANAASSASRPVQGVPPEPTRREPGTSSRTASGEGRPTGETPSAEFNPFEALSQMFETGRDVQAQQLAAFESILDNVWGAPRKA